MLDILAALFRGEGQGLSLATIIQYETINRFQKDEYAKTRIRSNASIESR